MIARARKVDFEKGDENGHDEEEIDMHDVCEKIALAASFLDGVHAAIELLALTSTQVLSFFPTHELPGCSCVNARSS